MYKLNRRIILKAWDSETDIYGGNNAVPVASYELWAEASDRSGSIMDNYMQAVWQYDMKFVFRDEKSRQAGSNYTIDYDGKRFVIKSITHDKEAHRAYIIARCSAIDVQIDEDSGGAVEPVTGNVYDYTGTGGEDSFSSGLLYKSILVASKDGIIHEVIYTDTAAGKQVYYNNSTGEFTWGTNFSQGEIAQIVYR